MVKVVSQEGGVESSEMQEGLAGTGVEGLVWGGEKEAGAEHLGRCRWTRGLY